MQQLSNYESLRSWYLAKLRKSAIEAQVSGQLTPSALIAADREVIEKLIAERSEHDEKLNAENKADFAALKFVLFLWLYLLLGLMVSIYLYCLGDGNILADVISLSVNPANLTVSDNHSLPAQIELAAVQLVLYVYPVVFIPFAFFLKSR